MSVAMGASVVTGVLSLAPAENAVRPAAPRFDKSVPFAG